MISMPNHKPVSSHKRAFTLLEILVVLAVMAILLALIVPSFNSITAARKLDTSGAQTADLLALARQTAMARGNRVRWELANLGSGAEQDFRIQRIVEFKNGTWTEASRWITFPDTIILNTDAARTNLINPAGPASTVDFSYQGQVYTDKEVLRVTFLPDGTTLLSSSQSHFLSLEPKRGPKDANGDSANWLTIVINPVTGTAETYRP